MFWETAPPLSKGLNDRPPLSQGLDPALLSPSPLFLSCSSPCPALTSSLQLPLTVLNRHFYKRNISRATSRIGLSFFNHFLMSLYITDSFIRRTHDCRLQPCFCLIRDLIVLAETKISPKLSYWNGFVFLPRHALSCKNLVWKMLQLSFQVQRHYLQRLYQDRLPKTLVFLGSCVQNEMGKMHILNFYVPTLS